MGIGNLLRIGLFPIRLSLLGELRLLNSVSKSNSGVKLLRWLLP